MSAAAKGSAVDTSVRPSRTGLRAFRKGLRALEREVGLALTDQTECCGVTPAQCHLLLAVDEAGETSVGELSAELELDSSTLSRAVDGLVRAKLLARAEDPSNRRRTIVSLSASGKAKVASINELCDDYYEGLLGSLAAKDSKTIVAAMPLFVKAMRDWRLARASSGCPGQGQGGSR